MKKMLKIVAVILLIVIVAAAALLIYLMKRPAAPAGYQQSAETGGEIETKYMADGSFEVSDYEEPALQVFK